MKILCALLLPILLLSGCASVTVSNINSEEYLVQRRGDVISQGRLSDPTNTVLTALGLTDCENRMQFCINSVGESSVTDNESKISALAEMWLFRAMRAQKDAQLLKDAGEFQDEQKLNAQLLNDFIQTAKYSYAYLFFSGRKISDRALEDRQTQVKDYYNFAVQNVIEQLYRANKGKTLTDFPVREGRWNIYIKNPEQLSENTETVKELIPDTVLSFKGLKNQYSADGLGARMVLSTEGSAKEKDQPWRLMPYSSVTAMISFPGKSLNQILSADDVVVSTYDPSFVQSVKIGKTVVPLSANFSGAYGLWLANSDFASNSLSTIFGHGNIIDKPTVYLMRPYRKDLRTIILIHGLASSPEAWVNTANEIMGDKLLRDNYQIWQVYYPTNIPLLINRQEIAQAINRTIDHFDPSRTNPASKDITLIGHSMGGILTRLLVSDSGNTIIDALEQKYPQASEKINQMDPKFKSILRFKPLQGVSTAIFLAAPHQGTPYADASWARYLASFVKLPLSIVNKLGEMTLMIFGQDLPREINMTGVDNLSAKDPTIRVLAKLPISRNVTYYSIIGRENPEGPLEESSDGIVPYWSSHLDGAASEKVIVSGHSVQETPEVIIELRKILRNQLVDQNVSQRTKAVKAN